MNRTNFLSQVQLLLRILPYVVEDVRIALKGGTAINLFVRNMPRLSVDIDLTYLVIEDRNQTLYNISQILVKSAQKITSNFPNISIKPLTTKDRRVKKLIINLGEAIVKVEPNETFRGAVFPSKMLDLCLKAQDEFELFIEANTLALADLYGGKICAALDRQHPRDIFDIKILMENEGLTEDIRKAFLVYLISHNRPMAELLNPNRLDFKTIFDREFLAMTNIPVTYEELYEVRENLIQQIQTNLTLSERQFLLSVKEKNPNWELIGIPNIENFPSVKWKLQNLEKMSQDKHKQAVEKLKAVLKL